jgi:hypothetical protein
MVGGTTDRWDAQMPIAPNLNRWGPVRAHPAPTRNSDRLIKTVLTIAYFDRLGVPRLS